MTCEGLLSDPAKRRDINHQRRRLARAYELDALYRKFRIGNDSGGFVSQTLLRLKMGAEYQFLPHYFGDPPKWRMLLRRFGGKRTLPDFCVVGPIKSGSSDLAVNLLLHPCVQAPLAKEFELPRPETWRIFYPTERAKKRHAQIHGRALSPFLGPYLHWMELTYQLSKTCPDMKVVLILREPSQRIYSHWKWECFWAGVRTASELPFLSDFGAYVDSALDMFPDYPMYTACGFQTMGTSLYWRAVEFWMQCFGRDQVLVLDMAEYWKDRTPLLHRIHDFLGIARFDAPPGGSKINENPLRFPPADRDAIAKLQRFFEPYNEKLYEVIGKRFAW